MSEQGTVVEEFRSLHADRTEHLERAYNCAERSIPSVLRRPERRRNGASPDNFQSDVARFVSGLAGKMLQGLFPPGVPYYAQQLAPEIERDETISSDFKQGLKDQLLVQDLVILAMLEGASGSGGNDLLATLHDAERIALEQLLVCGDVCQRLDDDFQITNFPLNCYVVQRDSTGKTLFIITKEQVDPTSFSDEELSRAELDIDELRKKSVKSRVCTVYTRVEWQPWSKKWTVVREAAINDKGKIISEDEDTVTAIWSVPYKLGGDDNYGTGLCDNNYGDIHSFDELSRRLLNHADLASWFKVIVDKNSDLRISDLIQRNGTCHRDEVENGVARNIAVVKADKIADFSVVQQVHEQIRAQLGRAFLSDTGSVRQSERTTALEVARTTISELQNALGGAYSSVARYMQTPLFARAKFQCQGKRLIKSIPRSIAGKAIRAVPLTGLPALAAQSRFQNVVSFAELAMKLSPTAQARINEEVLLRVAARFYLVNEPGLIRTDEEMKAKVEEAMQAQSRQEARSRMIEAAGTITENAAANAAQ